MDESRKATTKGDFVMNTHAKNNTAPNRPLRADFTSVTLRRAQTAKRRSLKKQSGVVHIMKTSLFSLRTVSGATFAIAAITLSAAGAYALTNWFGGDPVVKQDASILHVDLSSCKGNLPPGVESTNRSDVQFKITANQHISAENLQKQLLIDCESQAVTEFYNPGKTYAYRYTTVPATITAVNGSTFTVSYQWAGKTLAKTFTLDANDPMYSQGQIAQVTDFHVGDSIVAAVPVASQHYAVEGTDTFATATVTSIFKTHYDTSKASGKATGINYQQNGIMPLDLYNQIHNK